jgi:eukaryotic-like serine/threonine-protein kinase
MDDDSQRWQRVEELCQAALEQPADVQSAYLDRACAGDTGLRRQVDALLAYSQTVDHFLETPIGAVAVHVLGEQAHRALAGRGIGTYVLDECIGQAVWGSRAR